MFLYILDTFGFNFLIALTETSSTMFNRCAESRFPYLAPDPNRKAFLFLPLSMMLAVYFLDALYQVKKFSSVLGLLCFYHKMLLDFVHFFASIDIIIWCLYFSI